MKNIIKLMTLKDLKQITKNKIMIISLSIVPFIFAVALPLALFLFAGYIGEEEFDKIIGILGNELSAYNAAQQSIYIGVNYYFPTLFLFIPLLASSISAGNSFAGERETKTIETLLYSPLTVQQLFRAKVISTFILSYIITIASFILFAVIVLIGQTYYFDTMIFPNLKWMIFLFWVCPAVIILGLIFMVRVSATSKTYQEAQQKVAFIVMPLVFLIVGQSSGLFFVSTLWMFIIGTAIFAIDILISIAASESFIPEKLVN